ncbi:MAG: hypothetical protein WBK77_10335 [Alphaproteobacteria bacterium]
MFSSFGNIFITPPRQAESADARLDIRRHDPDQENRRRKRDENSSDAFDGTEDSATVTVEALRLFLENFLKSLEPKKDDGVGTLKADLIIPDQDSYAPPPVVDGAQARAAGVYRHVAQGVEKSAAPIVRPDNVSAPSVELGADDVRTIYKLIDDLKPLIERGITHVTIERGESFLGSLVRAVTMAAARL